MEYPLVSVAVITYNQKDFLKECIHSVLSQDYKSFEIIISDDGSTDGTHEMLHEFDKQFPGKFVLRLSEKNQGITSNSNQAHFACSGKYIAWMGGDDIMMPGKIRKQVEYMEAHPECSICYHDLEHFESPSGKTLGYHNTFWKARQGKAEVLIKYGTFNGACSNMVRKEKAPLHGFDKRIPIASDWLYWIETLLNGGEIQFINEVLGRYRIHKKNISGFENKSILLNLIDHSCSISIIMVKFPQYTSECLYRMAVLLRTCRKADKTNYFKYILSSLKVKFTAKSFILLLAFVVTFGKFRK